MDLGEVAFATGYADQAHFNHDFRDLTGMTPSAYLARRSVYLNHVDG